MKGLVRAELRKVTSLRSLWGTVLAGGVVTVVLAVFVGLTGSLQPDDTVLGGSLTGAVLALILAAVVGAGAMTSEIGSGTLAVTLAASPRRGRVLAAKAVVVAALVAVVGLVASGIAVVVGSALIDGDRAAGEPFPALLGVAVALALAAVMGLAVGSLVRHPGGAVAAVVRVTLLPQVLGPLAGDLQPWVVGLSPATALEKVTQSSDANAEVAGSLGPTPSLVALGVVCAVLLAVASRALERRDV